MTVEPRPRRKRNKSQWPMIAAGLLVVLVAGYLVWSVIGKKSSGTTYTTQQATRGTLSIAVAGNGNVVSKNSASVNPAISGTVTQLNVTLGAKVKKGDVLFVLDNTSLDANVTSAKSSYQQSKASTLKAAQAETQADASLRTGVLQAEQAVQSAQSAVYRARDTYYKDTVPTYPGYKAASRATKTADKKALDAANTGLKTAQVNYQHACRIQREGHAAAEASYDAAVTGQSASHSDYKQSITNAGQRTVTAPISGYVTTLNITNGDQLGNTSSGSGGSSSRSSSTGGSTAAASSSSSTNGTPIVISNLSDLQAQVQIAETDRPKVKIDQKVELTFDAVPNLTITGRVKTIDAVGTASSGVVTYNVTITFDVQDARLSPGMSASASIVTQIDTNVLLVPNAAVKTDTSGASYVQVLDTPTGTPRNVDVTLGPAGDTQTEIQSGLSGNENVVVQTISANSGSSSARSGLSVLGGGARGGGGGGGGGFRPPGN